MNDLKVGDAVSIENKGFTREGVVSSINTEANEKPATVVLNNGEHVKCEVSEITPL
jgi:hypothetical protein